jgi:hypothetical protein
LGTDSKLVVEQYVPHDAPERNIVKARLATPAKIVEGIREENNPDVQQIFRDHQLRIEIRRLKHEPDTLKRHGCHINREKTSLLMSHPCSFSRGKTTMKKYMIITLGTGQGVEHGIAKSIVVNRLTTLFLLPQRKAWNKICPKKSVR